MQRRSTMRCAIGLVAALMMAVSGCAEQNGHTVAQWDRGREATMTTAPHDGDYALYTSPASVPIIQPLHKGDKLGFEKLDDGRVQARARAFSVVLREQTDKAFWKDQMKK